MAISILSIGTELLNGRTINSNASYIAKKLSIVGFSVDQILSVSDTEENLVSAFKQLALKSTIIICSGGLGPTNDDITRQVVAKYFEQDLINFEEEQERLRDLIKRYNLKKEFSEANKMQSYYPKDAHIFPNKIGSASGFLLKKDHCIYIFLPGVPIEMEHLIDDEVLPYLSKTFQTDSKIHSELFRTINCPESLLYEKLRTLIEANPKVDFSFYPHFLFVDVYLKGEKSDIVPILNEVENLLKDDYYSRDESHDLIDCIQNLLIEKKKTLSVAESCTGGLLAAKLTQKSGISACFRGGLITYDNEMKQLELGVNRETIERWGAVSEACVTEMAMGAQYRFKTDYALAISGIAGPRGATKEKAVGTVCFALASENKVLSKTRQIGRERLAIQERSVQYALYLLWKALSES